jgi:AraC-like DNA-binding protein
MSLWDVTRAPSSVQLLLDFGAEQGLAQAQLLQRSGLLPAQLANPQTEVTALQELRVAENLLRAMRHPPGLGLAVGCRYRFSTFGLWGLGLVSSASMRAALGLALRFIPLTYAYCAISVHESERELEIRFSPPELPAGVRRFLVERDVAAAAVLMQDLGVPGFALNSLRLGPGRGRWPAPAQLPRIAGVRPRYDAADCAISFDRAFLDRRLPNADAATVAMCEQMCAQLLERRQATLGTARVLRQQLGAASDGGLPSLAAFARQANTSARTLKRRLASEGTSFRALVAETRSELAAELVRERRLSLTDIALRLGYADLSSFSQAFKRWHGLAPQHYRRQAGQSAP